MLLAVEGGCFFSSSTSGCSKGLAPLFGFHVRYTIEQRPTCQFADATLLWEFGNLIIPSLQTFNQNSKLAFVEEQRIEGN